KNGNRAADCHENVSFAESGRRADRLLPGGAKAPSAVHFFGVSPRSGPFRWGSDCHGTGQLSGGRRKSF
ncbi:hypothetical protein, partial [Escherichia coli]|uniref:hypothetical protein n=2 Tax=Escherichia coli TaxID=562 RepID=UPI001BC83666